MARGMPGRRRQGASEPAEVCRVEDRRGVQAQYVAGMSEEYGTT